MSTIKTIDLKPVLYSEEEANHRDYKNLIYGEEVKRTVPIYRTFYMGYFLADPQEFKKKSAACKVNSLGYDINIGINNEARVAHAEGYFYVIPFIEKNAILQQKEEFSSTNKTFYSPNHPSILEDSGGKRYYHSGRIPPRTPLPQYISIKDAQLLYQPIVDQHNLFGNLQENSSIGISIYIYNPNQVLVPYFFVKDPILRCKYESACFITFQGEYMQSTTLRYDDGVQPSFTPTTTDYYLAGWRNEKGQFFFPDQLPLAGDVDVTYTAVWHMKKPIFVQTQQVKTIYVGDKPIKEMYLGDKKIYRN